MKNEKIKKIVSEIGFQFVFISKFIESINNLLRIF